MRKWKTVVIIILFLCLIPCITALAKTGKVTASSLNIRRFPPAEKPVMYIKNILRLPDLLTVHPDPKKADPRNPKTVKTKARGIPTEPAGRVTAGVR